MIANSMEVTDEASAVGFTGCSCVGVESDCSGGGNMVRLWRKKSYGELNYELVDEMKQNLNEAFCGYGG